MTAEDIRDVLPFIRNMEFQNWREQKMKLPRRIIIGESYSRIAILPNVMTASSLMPLREEIGSPVRVNLPGRNARWGGFSYPLLAIIFGLFCGCAGSSFPETP